jgi:hypothetical protein
MGLFLFSANIIALSANLLTGAGVLISNPRSFNARVFAGVTLSSACYLLGRTSYAVPADGDSSPQASPNESERRPERFKDDFEGILGLRSWCLGANPRDVQRHQLLP